MTKVIRITKKEQEEVTEFYDREECKIVKLNLRQIRRLTKYMGSRYVTKQQLSEFNEMIIDDKVGNVSS